MTYDVRLEDPRVKPAAQALAERHRRHPQDNDARNNWPFFVSDVVAVLAAADAATLRPKRARENTVERDVK